jgi:hypothetical protein
MTTTTPRARGKAAPPPQDAPIVTLDDLTLLGTMNLRVMCFRREVVGNVGVPKDLIGLDGTTAILWRSKNDPNYDFDGWEPWHDGMSGGRKRTLASALHWVQRARDVRAGKATDFRGC